MKVIKGVKHMHIILHFLLIGSISGIYAAASEQAEQRQPAASFVGIHVPEGRMFAVHDASSGARLEQLILSVPVAGILPQTPHNAAHALANALKSSTKPKAFGDKALATLQEFQLNARACSIIQVILTHKQLTIRSCTFIDGETGSPRLYPQPYAVELKPAGTSLVRFTDAYEITKYTHTSEPDSSPQELATNFCGDSPLSVAVNIAGFCKQAQKMRAGEKDREKGIWLFASLFAAMR
jgi:hypothetical protein